VSEDQGSTVATAAAAEELELPEIKAPPPPSLSLLKSSAAEEVGPSKIRATLPSLLSSGL
jgi:hypothetical protein